MINNIRLQQNRKKNLGNEEEAAWLLAAERPKREHSALIEQLKMDVPIVTIKESEDTDALTPLLVQAVIEVGN